MSASASATPSLGQAAARAAEAARGSLGPTIRKPDGLCQAPQ